MDQNFPNKPVEEKKEEPSSDEIAPSTFPDETKKISPDSSANNLNKKDKENFSDIPLINKEGTKKNEGPPVESISTDDFQQWLDEFSKKYSGLKTTGNKRCDDLPASKVRLVEDKNSNNVPSTSKSDGYHSLKSPSISNTYPLNSMSCGGSNLPACLPQKENYDRRTSTMSYRYQLQYLCDHIVPGLLIRKRTSEILTGYYGVHDDNSTLDKIHDTLRNGHYKTARQCIADIDKYLTAVYMQKEPTVFPRECALQIIRRVEEEFHQKIINLNWKMSASLENDSPYYPISVLTEPGRLTNQLKYLRDKVLKYLRNHQYSFLLQRESPVLPAGGSSDEGAGEREMITLEIIEERLKNNKYHTAEQCVEDIDTLFMDCYVHKTVDMQLMQTLASIQIGLHDKIAVMIKKEREIKKGDFGYYAVGGEGLSAKNSRQLLYLKNVVAPELSKHEYADPFKTSKEFKQYLSILYDKEDIEEPVSLSKIKKRLQENKYLTPMECIQDYDLMFDKVLQTGLTEHLLYVQAEGLKKFFEEKIQLILNFE